MADYKDLTVTGFYAENFMRIKVVKLTPEGVLINIAGDNDNGKTSLLDAIWAAMDASGRAVKRPIREGADEAVIELTLGDASGDKLIITRKFTEASGAAGYLSITTPDGMKPRKPQTLIAGMMSTLSLDPLSFTKEPPVKKAEILRAVAGIGNTLDKLDAERRAKYEARTRVNAAAESARVRAEAINLPEDMPDEPPDIEAIGRRLANAGEINAVIDTAARAHEQRRQDAIGLRSDIKRREAEILGLQAALDDKRAALVECETDIAEFDGKVLPPRADTTALLAEMTAARVLLDAFAQQDRQIAAYTEQETAETEAAGLTLRIQAIDEERQAALAAAKFPVEGLGIQDGQVTLNNVPFEQASHAMQIRASTAIALAANPGIKVVLIRDASTLDAKSKALIVDMVTAAHGQVWMETIDPLNDASIIMEDGSVRGATVEGEKVKADLAPGETVVPGTGEVVEEQPPADPAQAERERKAEEFLQRSLIELASREITKDHAAAVALNSRLRAKLKNFPDLVTKRWNPVYLERLRGFAK